MPSAHKRLRVGASLRVAASPDAELVCGSPCGEPQSGASSASLRRVLDDREVLRLLGARACLSHEVAARLLGIELVDDDGTCRVTVPRNHSRRTAPGWRVVRADVPELEVLEEDGLRCTDAARTTRDLARVLPFPEAVAAADSALRQGIMSAEAVPLMLRAQGRGAAKVRRVGRHVDGLSGSVLESLLRVALAEAGIPAPRTQHRILDEHGDEVARVDFCWPEQRLIVEADGFAFHSGREDYRRDRRRMNELERLAWRVLRFTWEDVTQRPGHVAALVSACLLPLAA